MQELVLKSLLSLIVVFLLGRYWIHTNSKKLPPGPPGLPLLGNMFQMSGDLWLKFTEWKHQYGSSFATHRIAFRSITVGTGSLVFLNLAGQPMLVLNSHKTAVDLLDRRAPTYSDRPRHIVASEILTGGLFLGLSRYNEV
jgi:hypothetical protein